MKVKELIEKLQKAKNQDAEVTFCKWHHLYSVLFATQEEVFDKEWNAIPIVVFYYKEEKKGDGSYPASYDDGIL